MNAAILVCALCLPLPSLHSYEISLLLVCALLINVSMLICCQLMVLMFIHYCITKWIPMGSWYIRVLRNTAKTFCFIIAGAVYRKNSHLLCWYHAICFSCWRASMAEERRNKQTCILAGAALLLWCCWQTLLAVYYWLGAALKQDRKKLHNSHS